MIKWEDIKIGHLYTNGIDTYIKNGKYFVRNGDILRILKSCHCQSDLHYISSERSPKHLFEGQKVKVLGFWINFYGSYIKCEHDGEKYDIEPQNLGFYREDQTPPEPKPFTLDDYELFIGKTIKRKGDDDCNLYLITQCNKDGVYFGSNGSFETYETLLERYIFVNNNICGILEKWY